MLCCVIRLNSCLWIIDFVTIHILPCANTLNNSCFLIAQTQMREKPIAIRETKLASFRTPRTNTTFSLEYDSSLKEDSPLDIFASTSICSSTISSFPKGLISTPIIYNDAWAEKQYSTYQRWLNFCYQGMDGVHGNNPILELDTVQPTERQTARTLLLQSQQAYTRQIAINLYRKPEMIDIRYAIELDVKNKLLSFRPDPNVLANVLLHDRLVSLLLSYSVPWLRLGLETIFGRVITETSLSKSLGPESETQRLSGMRKRGSKKVNRIYIWECLLFTLIKYLTLPFRCSYTNR